MFDAASISNIKALKKIRMVITIYFNKAYVVDRRFVLTEDLTIYNKKLTIIIT